MSVATLWRGALRHIGWVLGLAVIAIVVGAVLRIGDLHAFATMLENARPSWLLVALGLQATHGAIAVGMPANFVLWDLQEAAELAYWFGQRPVRCVVRQGRVALHD